VPDKEALLSPTAQLEPNREAAELFDGLPPRYDLLAYLLSFGQDRRWRRSAVTHIEAGPASRVLDVATGPGGVAFAVRASTGAEVVGADLTRPMLLRALANIARRGEAHVRLVQARGEELPFRDGSFDAVTFSYLLRYVADPAATVSELARVVRPGGTMASLEFHVPPALLWRSAWWCYTRAVLPALGLLLGGREWFAVGRFLGPSISDHYRHHPVESLARTWREAGMTGVAYRLQSLGGGLVMWGRKPEERGDG
jgi:demethylmenaquinone methyltransferase/2-methoxy-6-polyprenyl-1,4-benzoquinol methylase